MVTVPVRVPEPPPRERPQLVLQTGPSDCGPAAITMTLAHYGHPLPLELVKLVLWMTDGTSALQLVRVAQAVGLGAVGVSASIGELAGVLRTGDILWVGMNHFVVYAGSSHGKLDLLDPADGERHVTVADFEVDFSRFALLFGPSEPEVRARIQGG